MTLLNAVLKTGTAIEPIEISEAQQHLIIDGQNDYVNLLIMTAREMLERYLNRSLIAKTWTAYANDWCTFLLPYGPLLSVASIKYWDQGGTLQTLGTDQYWVDTVNQPGRIVFAYNFPSPILEYGRPNAIEIEFTAGYLATGTREELQQAVPMPLKHGMKVLLTDLHEHRGQFVIGNNANKLPQFVIDLIHPYRLYNF